MSRRKTYSKLIKENQIRASHVRGKGDTAYLGFQCINPDCTHFLFIEKEQIIDDFEIECPDCGDLIYSGGETTFFDYDLEVEENGVKSIKETGQFTVIHDEYVEEAQEYKYCINCNMMKPLSYFDKHSARKTGRQGECRLCKRIYNSVKNGTRTIDQFRESAQKRRLYLELSGQSKLDSKKVYDRFKYSCFKCNTDLSNAPTREIHLDHTLPVYYLWPLDTNNATLLCGECNGEKAGSWPSDFYNMTELRELSIITGIQLDLLSGGPEYNPAALERLMRPEIVNEMLTKYSKYMPELIKLRNRLLNDTGLDFFSYSTILSPNWIEKADKIFSLKYG